MHGEEEVAVAGHPSDDERAAARERLIDERMARQVALFDRLERDAVEADDPLRRCVGWMAVERHARRLLRAVDEVYPAAAGAQEGPLAGYRSVVRRFFEEAASHVAGTDEHVRSKATSGLGLRIAVMGKGGAGKTLIAGTLARLLAQRGRTVLAVDLDPNPGLAFGLGMPVTDAGLPPEAVQEDEHGGWLSRLVPGLTAVDAVQQFSTLAPDGVRYLGLGKITDPERHGMRKSLGPLFEILSNLADPGWDVVGDFEAGTSTPFQRYHLFFADQGALVVGPSWASALTARRLQGLLGGLPAIVVANRFQDVPDHSGLAPEVRIPFDAAVAEADRRGLAPLDFCPTSPAVQAVGELIDVLIDKEVLG